jgi:hypothetical protein
MARASKPMKLVALRIGEEQKRMTSGTEGLWLMPPVQEHLPAQAAGLAALLSRPRRNLAAPSAALGSAALDQFLEPLQIAAHAPLVEADG